MTETALRKIGILGGSFNPVHVGHMMLASYIQQFTDIDKVWLTLSPRNPLKSRPNELISDLARHDMLRIATSQTSGIEVCDIELSMPRPNYTIDTLRLLRKRYPRNSFQLIIGSDNWRIFTQWRDYQEIIDDFGVIVYPRPGYRTPTIYEDNVEIIDAPENSLSSTFIRDSIMRGKNMHYFLPEGVYDYIRAHDLYKIQKQ